MRQSLLFCELEADQPKTERSSTTFADNLRLPVHRWIRFSAGFSGAWAQHLIQTTRKNLDVRVLDPFAGSGTTLIAAENARVSAYGVEAHPFVFRLASAKLLHRSKADEFAKLAKAIRNSAQHRKPSIEGYPQLIRKCFTDAALGELDCLRAALEAMDDGSHASRLAWLTLVGILRACSHVGTAQWQYVLPKKRKKFPASPYAAFDALSRVMLSDMAKSSVIDGPQANLIQGDARDCGGVPDQFATLVITSPPYPNNYDYADATRLEMCFLREINGWGDLQASVRRFLMRSCTQQVPESAVDLHETIAEPLLTPIRPQISEVCDRLAKIRLSKGGRKTYHLMIATYFHDMARTWNALRRVCDSPSQVCFVIGDSAPYGVYVPVIDWIGMLAIRAGFKSFHFEKTRDRNTKWKNRKHRVPLCEGRLWVEG
ncbi:MAG TPA: DNA methyltransferase [Pirellulales bacterium]|nr:DNA methyltransferase [Pirellulales bacterium]